MANRRSHSGIIVYINNAPIIWYIKLQNTVEASSFVSEFLALRIDIEIIEALRYKLRCFVIRVEVHAGLFCDNMSVVNNYSKPNSELKNRHNAIFCHRVMEAQAAFIPRVVWIPGEFKLSDLFTNTKMHGNTRHNLVD